MTTSPELQALIRRRWRMSLTLTGIIVVLYAGFLLSLAFAKPFFATQVVPGFSVGMAMGLGLLLTSWLLTGVYVRWANNHYDQAVNDLKKTL